MELSDIASPKSAPITAEEARALDKAFGVSAIGDVRDTSQDNEGASVWDDPEFLEARKAEYIEHLVGTCAYLNTFMAKEGIGVEACCEKAIRDIENHNYDPVYKFFTNADRGGRIWPNQLKTACMVFKELLRNPTKSGTILGAMQSGKTGSQNATQFFGPIHYLLTGVKICPLYLVTSQISHEEQTRNEFERFLTFYGAIQFKRGKESCTLREFAQDANRAMIMSATNPVLPVEPKLSHKFVMDSSLNTYRREILGEHQVAPISIDQFLMRRVHGKRTLANVRDLVRRMREQGFELLFLVDESHHGASDRKKSKETDEDGNPLFDPCVLKQFIQEFDAAVGKEARVICSSATPFDTVNVDTFWTVRQKLPPNYMGYNFFLGQTLDPEVDAVLPNVQDFETFGKMFDVPFLKYVNIGLVQRHKRETAKGGGAGKQFAAWAIPMGYPHIRPPHQMSWDEQADLYCRRVARELRNLVHNIARFQRKAKNGDDLGIVMRLCNDNKVTKQLLEAMKIDQSLIDVLCFFDETRVTGGLADKLGATKDFIDRKRAENRSVGKPYLIVVTGRARMGDAFPVGTEIFIELANAKVPNLDGSPAKINSTMNALLQGLLGRACGAGKNSIVCMSPSAVEAIRLYVETRGALHQKPSEHADVLDDVARPRRATMMKVKHTGGAIPVFDTFMERVNLEIVQKVVKQGSPDFAQERSVLGHNEFLPLYKLMRETGLLAYLQANPAHGFVQQDVPLSATPKIAMPGDIINYRGRDYGFSYDETDDGWVYIGFRNDDGGGRGSRGTALRKGRDPHSDDMDGLNNRLHRVRSTTHIEPQINLVRVDPVTRARMDSDDPRPSDRVAMMVTIPLLEQVKVSSPGSTNSLMKVTHALDPRLSDEQRAERQAHAEAKARAAQERAAAARRRAEAKGTRGSRRRAA